MPANRFAPDRIVVGHSQDPAVIDRILQRLLGRWPIEKCDIKSVFHAAVDYSDGSMVPSENINVDELLTQTTGVIRALGCLDLVVGLALTYKDATTLKLLPGMLLHRNDFKQSACEDEADGCTEVPTVGLVHTADSIPADGNASGLDDDLWYYIYANMSAAGAFPTIGEFLRVSILAPVECDGFGLEHPNDQSLRFIGSIRTMDNGEVRPFDRMNNGWVFWRTIAVATEWAADGYGYSAATAIGATTTGFETYQSPNTTGGSAYHQGLRHIPASADFCEVTGASTDATEIIKVRPIGDAGGGTMLAAPSGSPDVVGGSAKIAVNMPGLTAGQLQTFEIDTNNNGNAFDVIGYHERIQ